MTKNELKKATMESRKRLIQAALSSMATRVEKATKDGKFAAEILVEDHLVSAVTVALRVAYPGCVVIGRIGGPIRLTWA